MVTPLKVEPDLVVGVSPKVAIEMPGATQPFPCKRVEEIYLKVV